MGAAGTAPGGQALNNGYTARDLVRGLFYYKRPVAIAFLIPVILGLVVAVLRPPSYTAEARLLVLPGEEYSFRREVGAPQADITMDRNQFAQSEAAILRDAALQAQTLQALGPAHVLGSAYDPTAPNAMTRAVAALSADLSITALPQSNAITLNYRNRDPEIAAAVLNQLITFYLDARPAVYNRSALPTLIEQRDLYAKRLHDAEDALQQFGKQHDITDLTNQVSLLLKQRADLQQQQTDLAQRTSSATAQVQQLRLQLTRIPQNVQQFVDTTRSVAGDVRSTDLVRLQAQRQEMVSHYQPDAPQIVDLDRQIAEATARQHSSSSRDLSAARQGRNPLFDDISASLSRAEAEEHGLEASAVSLQTAQTALVNRLSELDGASQQYRMLERNRDVLADSYKSFSSDVESARVNDQLDQKRFGNVRLVQAATPPASPAATRRLLAMGSLVLGLISAIATLTILSALRQVVIDRIDAERGLGLPVLLTVTLSTGRRGRQSNQPGMQEGRRS